MASWARLKVGRKWSSMKMKMGLSVGWWLPLLASPMIGLGVVKQSSHCSVLQKTGTSCKQLA